MPELEFTDASKYIPVQHKSNWSAAYQNPKQADRCQPTR